MAANADGKVTAVRSVVYAGMGAYLSTAAPGIPTILHGLMYSGPYDIANIKADVYGVFTNSTPVEAYRGAGPARSHVPAGAADGQGGRRRGHRQRGSAPPQPD